MKTMPTDPISGVQGGKNYGYNYAYPFKKTGAITYNNTPGNNDYIIGMRLGSGTGPTYFGWSNGDLNWLDGS